MFGMKYLLENCGILPVLISYAYCALRVLVIAIVAGAAVIAAASSAGIYLSSILKLIFFSFVIIFSSFGSLPPPLHTFYVCANK